MTNASDTIYYEFVNSCKKLEANYGHEMKKAELRESTESQTDHSHPLQRCSECRPIITMDYLKRLQKLMEGNSIQIYQAISQPLAQKVLTAHRNYFYHFILILWRL